MAILVGITAPVLIKYVNKSKVSADIQLCDTVKEAILVSMADPDIITDAKSAPYLNKLNNGQTLQMGTVATDSEFGKNLRDITGFDCITISGYRSAFETKIAQNQGFLCAELYQGRLYVWIDQSDNTGKDNTCYRASYANQLSSNTCVIATR